MAITLHAIHTNAGNTIPLIHIGSIITGFHAIQPNTTGSLILKIVGPIQARPKDFSFFDLDNARKITSGMVRFATDAVPAVASAIFAAMLCNFTGDVAGARTHEEIPME